MSSQSCSQNARPVAALMQQIPFWNEVLTCFRSVHLAIVLLSLMAVGTLIGVVFPQEGMVEITEIEKQFGTNFKFLNTLGFFNVFSSFWFITLQILFFFNLLIGSFKWLKPATLAAVQKYTLSPELITHKPDAHSLPSLVEGPREEIENRLTSILKQFRYRIHTDGKGNFYAFKGNITRLGPSAAHFGILLCLIAGLYSNFTGFKAVRMAVPGQTFSIPEANSFKTNIAPSIWLGQVPEWKIHVKDFRIVFYEDHPDTPKQYYSDLEIRSPDGKLLQEKTISVNHPMIYEDISIYQASFAPTGRFHLKIDGNPVTVETNNQFNQRPISLTPLDDKGTLIMFPFFAQQDPGVTENFGVFFIRYPGETFVEGQMPENIRLKVGETGVLKGRTITYEKPEMSTGLQIKRAPEVPLMYLAYIIIALGTALCFFSQRQLWISLREVSPHRYEVLLHPKTNKARLSFRNELARLQQALLATFSNSPTVKDQQL